MTDRKSPSPRQKSRTASVPGPLKPVMSGGRRDASRPRPDSRAQRPQTSIWRRVARASLWTLTAISALGLFAASYGGELSPSQWRGICIVVMTMPAWIVLMLIATVLDALWCRKALILCALAFVSCSSAIWEFSPLNITRPDAAAYASCPRFTFMTYNVGNLCDQTETYPGGVNPTISYILRTQPDVVNLQEVIVLSAYKNYCITEAQIDSLHRAYPYIIWYGYSQVLMSKYPAEPIHTGSENKAGNEIAAFRLNIEGTPVTLFDVHLQSFNLTSEDKALYKDLTRLNEQDGNLRGTLVDVKSQLLHKIQVAAEQRECDIKRLSGYISHYGGPNVIVAGDFNDVPGCYALRRLGDFKLRQVYPEVGFGPMITFNRDRFYFRIDHILYRGDLKPLSITRGSIRYSDHYPLIATFAVTPQK